MSRLGAVSGLLEEGRPAKGRALAAVRGPGKHRLHRASSVSPQPRDVGTPAPTLHTWNRRFRAGKRLAQDHEERGAGLRSAWRCRKDLEPAEAADGTREELDGGRVTRKGLWSDHVACPLPAAGPGRSGAHVLGPRGLEGVFPGIAVRGGRGGSGLQRPG